MAQEAAAAAAAGAGTGGDDAARQRKLQPLRSAMASGNYVGVIKQSLKRDIAQWEVAKAYRSYALCRVGRREEAMDLAREVKARVPTDMETLNTLADAFRMGHCAGEAVEAFEAALQARGGAAADEALAKQLFGALVTIVQPLRQQQLATKLYQQHRDKPVYLFWAVTSMLQQVRGDGENAAPRAMLGVGAAMLEKHFTEREPDRQPSAQEFLLYVTLLQEQQRHDRALEAVQELVRDRPHDLAEIVDEDSMRERNLVRLGPEELLSLELELLEKGGMWERACAKARDVLDADPDQWIAWVALARDTACHCLDAAMDMAAAEEAFAALRTYAMEMAERHSKCRGPKLALLEMLRQWVHCSHCMQHPLEEQGQSNEQRLRALEANESAMATAWAEASLPAGWVPTTLDPPFPDLDSSVSSAYRELAVLLAQHALRQGFKPCAFHDIKIFVAVLVACEETGNARNSLRAYLRAQVATDTEEAALMEAVQQWDAEEVPEYQTSDGSADGQAAADEAAATRDAHLERQQEVVGKLQTYITVMQLSRLLQGEDAVDTETTRTELRRLVRVYDGTLALNKGASGGQREAQKGDDLIMLAVAGFADLHQIQCTSGKSGAESLATLLECGALLKYACGNSPYNFHFKLALMRVYEAAVAAEMELDLFNSLEVKHLQLDSLSHLILPACANSCFFTEFRTQHRNVMAVHSMHLRDTHTQAANGFQRGNYVKALEILDFQRISMAPSLQLALARTENCFTELAIELHTLPAVQAYLPQVFTDAHMEGMAAEPPADPAAYSDNMDYFFPSFHAQSQPSSVTYRPPNQQQRKTRHIGRLRAQWLALRALMDIVQDKAETAGAIDARLSQLEREWIQLGYVDAPSSSPTSTEEQQEEKKDPDADALDAAANDAGTADPSDVHLNVTGSPASNTTGRVSLAQMLDRGCIAPQFASRTGLDKAFSQHVFVFCLSVLRLGALSLAYVGVADAATREAMPMPEGWMERFRDAFAALARLRNALATPTLLEKPGAASSKKQQWVADGLYTARLSLYMRYTVGLGLPVLQLLADRLDAEAAAAAGSAAGGGGGGGGKGKGKSKGKGKGKGKNKNKARNNKPSSGGGGGTDAATSVASEPTTAPGTVCALLRAFSTLLQDVSTTCRRFGDAQFVTAAQVESVLEQPVVEEEVYVLGGPAAYSSVVGADSDSGGEDPRREQWRSCFHTMCSDIAASQCTSLTRVRELCQDKAGQIHAWQSLRVPQPQPPSS